MRRRAAQVLLRAVLGAVLSVGAGACGGEPTPDARSAADVEIGRPVATTTPPAPPPPPAPPRRDALDLTVALVQARAGALVHVDAWREHPMVPQILGQLPYQDVLERAGIDVAKDVDRILVAGPDPRQWTGAAVYEHHIDRARLDRFLEEAKTSSSPPGEALQEGGMTGARVHIQVRTQGGDGARGYAGDIWLVTPTLIVVVPPRTPGVAGLARSGGLPLPVRGEGATGWTFDPAHALANRHVAIPSTLSRADAWVFARPGGGVGVELRARSTSPDQATSDARQLTGALARATSVKFGPLTVRVFQTPVLRAEGDEVVGETEVTRAQLGQLLTFARSSLPRY